MINIYEVTETNNMVEKENLDVRTITMGISLLDCIDSDLNVCLDKIYKKITESAKDLVKTGEETAQEFGVPIVNKRISVTPIALVGGAACKTPEDFAKIAEVMDKAAHEVGVNFIGGYSALVQFHQPWLHQNRYQHGCCPPAGRNHQRDGGVHKGAGFLRLCKAGGILQCAGR